jgi:hypothetical protein
VKTADELKQELFAIDRAIMMEALADRLSNRKPSASDVRLVAMHEELLDAEYKARWRERGECDGSGI